MPSCYWLKPGEATPTPLTPSATAKTMLLKMGQHQKTSPKTISADAAMDAENTSMNTVVKDMDTKSMRKDPEDQPLIQADDFATRATGKGPKIDRSTCCKLVFVANLFLVSALFSLLITYWVVIHRPSCDSCCVQTQLWHELRSLQDSLKLQSQKSGAGEKFQESFKIVESFDDHVEKLIQLLKSVDCKGGHIDTKNLSLPVAGSELAHHKRKKPSYVEGNADSIPSQCDLIADSFKFDCHPEPGANQKVCESRGCCWQTSDSNHEQLGVPACFYPTLYEGYSYVNVTKTDTGFLAFLKRSTKSYYPDDVNLLRLDVLFETQHRLHIKITDALHPRYEVPIPLMPSTNTHVTTADYDVKFLSHRGFQVIRVSSGEILFDVSVGGFLFADQFIQLSALLPSTYLYGIGEQRGSFVNSFSWKRIVLFAADHVPEENTNLYGVHPFYLMMEGGAKSHGVYFHNSNAMEIILQPAPAITFRTIGGILDFYFFLGPSPSDVVSQYTELIGRPFLPPYWSLGFHLCRYNYGSVEKTREVWQRTRDAGIPFDVQWNDIDYMDKKRDFTVGEKYNDLGSFVDDIHRAGMHYIPIIDCAIATTSKRGEYPPYDEGNDMNIFIKDSTGKNFVGQVWPGDAVWPDFTNLNATSYWTIQIQKFHTQVPFDGIWLDMNEPSNFISGTKTGCPDTKWDNPPYVPAVVGDNLAHVTVCMSAKQNASLHYDVHSLYGVTETMATNYALSAVRKKRPFIISRSTYPGHGFYGGHWTGDINSLWHDMRRSVSDILNFNMFGIPMVGADICGFNMNTTKKLCQRWMELGAFYGFARNHNDRIAVDQDPVALGPEVVIASVKAFYMRYKLLPYLYTLFYHAHINGSTVARPLFFEFPNDRRTYNIDSQFLWGSGLMILPVLDEDVTIIYPYFPSGIWYLLPWQRTINSTGANFRVDSPLDTITLALRGGFILPLQDVNQSTTASRLQFFGLYVALDCCGEARGDVFWDDGDSLGTIKSGQYNLLQFQAKKNTLTSQVEKFAYQGEYSMSLGHVTVFGVQGNVTNVTVNGGAWQWYKFNNDTMVLDIERLQVRLNNSFTIVWG